jgi:hypothetical protein
MPEIGEFEQLRFLASSRYPRDLCLVCSAPEIRVWVVNLQEKWRALALVSHDFDRAIVSMGSSQRGAPRLNIFASMNPLLLVKFRSHSTLGRQLRCLLADYVPLRFSVILQA